ncbi:MAG: putative metal-binding motif-containing protein [Deltaproteobacteria bacterium]|nr:putative metal-binding motif-containing protein [Deltaproteobacteria bacterium]
MPARSRPWGRLLQIQNLAFDLTLEDAVGVYTDGDGWLEGWCTEPQQADCDDGDSAIHPTAEDVQDDAVDSDCDGLGGPEPEEPGGSPDPASLLTFGGDGCASAPSPSPWMALLGVLAIAGGRRARGRPFPPI